METSFQAEAFDMIGDGAFNELIADHSYTQCIS